MSSFRRTNSGLNNQHTFYDVDFVVFLEGGNHSFTKEEVYNGNHNLETNDIIFWNKIFETFVDNKRFKFKSIGSKKILMDIAQDIITGSLTTIYIAMDNEFDEILKKRISHDKILYTHGYSWENDVWNNNVIKSVVEELTAIKVASSDLEDNFNDFLKKTKTAINADGYLFKRGSSFFPRKTGYLFCINCQPVDLPFVKKMDIDSKFVEKNINKRNVNSFGRRHSISPLKFCYGHFLADYCAQLINHYIKKRHNLTTISRDIIYRIGLNKFFKENFKSSSIYDYYKAQFESKGLFAVAS